MSHNKPSNPPNQSRPGPSTCIHGRWYSQPPPSAASARTSSATAESQLVPSLGSLMISHSSSSSDSAEESAADRDPPEEVEDEPTGRTRPSIRAARAAAAWMSRGDRDAGLGSDSARSGKLRMAEAPLILMAATSWARAAISGVEKVPSQIRDFLRGSLISDTHFPQLRMRTPLYSGCFPGSPQRSRFAFFPGSGSHVGASWSFRLECGLSEAVVVEEGEDGEEDSEL